uniref:Uncharacterized protein n=1 Tax=Wuchereria bancrofti TaxID=6293 RepID=A0AAF5PI34_WUCBA
MNGAERNICGILAYVLHIGECRLDGNCLQTFFSLMILIWRIWNCNLTWIGLCLK